VSRRDRHGLGDISLVNQQRLASRLFSAVRALLEHAGEGFPEDGAGVDADIALHRQPSLVAVPSD
jgi:hypothetical protein